MGIEGFPSRDEGLDSIESEVEIEIGPFYLRNVSVKLIEGKIVEFVEDFEDDERSDGVFCLDDIDEYNSRGLHLDFEPATDDCNDGILKFDKEEVNELLKNGKIEFVYDKEYEKYDLSFLKEMDEDAKRRVKIEQDTRRINNYLNNK